MKWTIDLPELRADDLLLDQLSAAEDIADPDELTRLLQAWRDDIDEGLFPAPIPKPVVAAVMTWRRCA